MAGLDWFLYRVFSRAKRDGLSHAQHSYSQCGEDLIARFAFKALEVAAPTYLDIGAHHPSYLNNTRLFYDEGSRGVNVEPDPELFKAFEIDRPRDNNLNVGVGEVDGELPFYIMSVRTLNTFSEQEAQNIEREGRVRIERVVTLPVMSVNKLLARHCPDGVDFLSLDVEGMDLAILRSLDFRRYRPKLVCVESITYSERRSGRKIIEIADVMRDNGYIPFADTYVNSIYVDKDQWNGE